MRAQKQIENRIEELKTFRVLTQAYTEIAAIRMRKIRDTVLKNREYLAHLEDVFHDVRVSYARDVLKLGDVKYRHGDKVTFLSHNGKTVGLFLSANTGLYGDIIERTFEIFIKEVEKEDLEVAIVGRLGEKLYQARGPKEEYTFFDLSDKKINQEDLSKIIKHLVQYEEIRVYYPNFQSAVNQKPAKYVISAETPISELKTETKDKSHYIFEPSLKEVLMFFEKEIFASLLDQTIRESQLAKLAARIMALDRASENIKDKLKGMNFEKLKVAHRLSSVKQTERMVGLFK